MQHLYVSRRTVRLSPQPFIVADKWKIEGRRIRVQTIQLKT